MRRWKESFADFTIREIGVDFEIDKYLRNKGKTEEEIKEEEEFIKIFSGMVDRSRMEAVKKHGEEVGNLYPTYLDVLRGAEMDVVETNGIERYKEFLKSPIGRFILEELK